MVFRDEWGCKSCGDVSDVVVIDVGNSNTVIGAMEDAKVRYRWRITTKSRTTDETGMLLLNFLISQY